jgi:3'-5' exoribonuclease
VAALKEKFVADIAEDAEVNDSFLVARKALLRSRAGAPYLALTLADRSGQIEARIWDEAERLSARFSEGDFVRVRAQATVFRDSLQLAVTDIDRLSPSEVELADFLPSSERDPQEMLRELRVLSRDIGNAHLRALVGLFMADKPLLAAFARGPAAKNMHHAYLGGLLEHTLSVARLCRQAAAHYPECDADLLLAAAILHDIGKVRELSCAPGFDYTTEGRLIGHLLIGMEMLEDKLARLPDFPPGLATSLKHLIISHHGEYVFGSPKRPKIAEAFILHALDDLDAKLGAVRDLLRTAAADTATYHRVLERYIFGPLEGGRAGEAREEEPQEAAEANYSLLQPLLKGG